MMPGYAILHENSRVVIPGIISIKAMSIHLMATEERQTIQWPTEEGQKGKQ
jgi:hypothetical protein